MIVPLIRQVLLWALGMFREATFIGTAHVLSHSPEIFGVTITKGAGPDSLITFHLFLSAIAPSKIVCHTKNDFLGFDPKFSSFLE